MPFRLQLVIVLGLIALLCALLPAPKVTPWLITDPNVLGVRLGMTRQQVARLRAAGLWEVEYDSGGRVNFVVGSELSNSNEGLIEKMDPPACLKKLGSPLSAFVRHGFTKESQNLYQLPSAVLVVNYYLSGSIDHVTLARRVEDLPPNYLRAKPGTTRTIN